MLPLVLLAILAGAPPQVTPDFAGTWTTVSPMSAMGQALVIEQSDLALILSHQASGHDRHGTTSHHETYRLDGEPLRTERVSHGATMAVTTRAKWDGRVLVLTRSWMTPDGAALIVTQRLSVDENGRLAIEQTETTPGRLAQKTDIVLTRVALER